MTAPKKGGRRSGRRRAFEVLYGLCFAAPDDAGSLEQRFADAPDARTDDDAAEPTDDSGREEFAWALTQGVWEHHEDIDEIVNRFSQHWKIKRIARVELTILRVALYEMLYLDDIPTKVAINEAVELAKRYGDENSKNFVNGILDAVARAIENGDLRVH